MFSIKPMAEELKLNFNRPNSFIMKVYKCVREDGVKINCRQQNEASLIEV